MSDKIIAYEKEIERLKANTKKVTEQNNRKIKVLYKKIEAEKQKEQQAFERKVVNIVKQHYGEFNPENLEKFKKLMDAQEEL